IWPPSEFLIHTLLSLWVPSMAIWPSWPASVSHSLGVVHIRIFSLFLSNFAMALWYITPTQGLSSRSNSRSRVPSDHPGLTTGIGYCVTLPVFGSILPRNIWPKSEYQALPWRSSITSCGWISGFGRSYSVMITRVDLPVSRGSVFSGNDHVCCWLRLTLASHSAVFLPLPPRSTLRVAVPASRCGFRGVLPDNRGSSAGLLP